MNDTNEIIRLSCSKCKGVVEGTYKELFGDIPSLVGFGKLECECGGKICLETTGKYKLESFKTDWLAVLKNYDYPKRPCDTKCVDNCPARLDCPLFIAWEKQIEEDKNSNDSG